MLIKADSCKIKNDEFFKINIYMNKILLLYNYNYSIKNYYKKI